MIVLDAKSTEHQIILIPRYESESYELIMRDEYYNESETINIPSPTKMQGYTLISFAKELSEFASYQLTLKNGDLICWRGKAFATNIPDEVQNYEIGKDVNTLWQ